MSSTGRTASLMVGVVIAREPVDHPWQEFRWRPTDVFIGNPELATGEVLTDSESQTLYFAGAFKIELHRKETPAYVVNLENDQPVVYVVLKDAEDDVAAAMLPVVVDKVTVSPFDAQDYLDSGEENVEPVAMPAPLLAWLEHFVAEHHEEEVFIKRKRKNMDISEEKFGQEPIDVIRQRQKGH